jgi:hypothetical protein
MLIVNSDPITTSTTIAQHATIGDEQFKYRHTNAATTVDNNDASVVHSTESVLLSSSTHADQGE